MQNPTHTHTRPPPRGGARASSQRAQRRRGAGAQLSVGCVMHVCVSAQDKRLPPSTEDARQPGAGGAPAARAGEQASKRISQRWGQGSHHPCCCTDLEERRLGRVGERAHGGALGLAKGVEEEGHRAAAGVQDGLQRPAHRYGGRQVREQQTWCWANRERGSPALQRWWRASDGDNSKSALAGEPFQLPHEARVPCASRTRQIHSGWHGREGRHCWSAPETVFCGRWARVCRVPCCSARAAGSAVGCRCSRFVPARLLPRCASPRASPAWAPAAPTTTVPPPASKLSAKIPSPRAAAAPLARLAPGHMLLHPSPFASQVSLPTKLHLYHAVVVSTLVYGAAETWAPTQQQQQRLDAFHTTCLRRILGIRRGPDMPSNASLYGRTAQQPISTLLRPRRLAWLGHVGRLPDSDPTKQLLFAAAPAPPDGPPPRRARGGPAQTWNRTAHADLAAAFARAPPQRRRKSWLYFCLTRPDWRSFTSGMQQRHECHAKTTLTHNPTHSRAKAVELRLRGQQHVDQQRPRRVVPVGQRRLLQHCGCAARVRSRRRGRVRRSVSCHMTTAFPRRSGQPAFFAAKRAQHASCGCGRERLGHRTPQCMLGRRKAQPQG